ncbi:MAG: outer membrane lipoprotein carrier protein LolA [Flavobacteriaceae bacterium]|nr:outer membrane lipoprotein carrier protein LolA [Flavobacteriaceae bacterium]
MSASEIADFKTKVESAASATRTIQTDFVQFKHMDFLSNDIKTVGKMMFKAPDKVRWEYTEPYQYQVIFKEEQLLINDGGTKSKIDIGNSKLFKKLNRLIVNSVKGNMFIDDDFTMKYSQSPVAYKVIFTPKDEKIADYIAQFELLFSKEDNQVMEVKMIEPSKDFTRILFKNRVLNKTIDDAVFN